MILLLAASPLNSASEMDEARKQAMEFGLGQNNSAVDSIKGFDSSEIGNRDSFDADQAYSQVLGGKQAPSENRGYYPRENLVDANEMLFERSESYASGKTPPPSEVALSYAIRKCRQSAGRQLINVERSLVEETVRECKGHSRTEIFKRLDKARKRKKKLLKEMSLDTQLSNFFIDLRADHYWDTAVDVQWRHVDNSAQCPEWIQKGTGKSSWVYANPDHQALYESGQVKAIQQQSLSDGVQRLTLLQDQPSLDECSGIDLSKCTLIDQTTLPSTPPDSAVWEKTFKCFTSPAKVGYAQNDQKEAYGLQGELEATNGPGDSSFARVATSLAVFSEAEKELEASGKDADQVGLFGGKSHKCSKNILNNVLYDCCTAMDGLAVDVQLAKCSATEIALGKLNQQGRCHYIGSHKNDFLGMWTSSTSHVYCCFPSKLARVVQEQARKQLGMSWGTAEHPKCRGLTTENISEVDFSLMDLSELYEEQLKKADVDIEAKLKAFESRLLQVKGAA